MAKIDKTFERELCNFINSKIEGDVDSVVLIEETNKDISWMEILDTHNRVYRIEIKYICSAVKEKQ